MRKTDKNICIQGTFSIDENYINPLNNYKIKKETIKLNKKIRKSNKQKKIAKPPCSISFNILQF